MKKLVQLKSMVVMIALAAIFSSFAPMGAHSFQILLDDKQITDQYVKASMVAPKVIIDPAENHKQLVVKYNECGRTVTGRVISIKDINDKTLKEWRFEGATSAYKDPMTCSIKEIIALKPASNNTLKLVYASAEFPEGQQIATLVIGAKTTASR